MSKHIQLAIADPCYENWDNMTKAEQGRFCASCQKQVVDFSCMSDSQLVTFFKRPSIGSVCGRFFHDQLDRDIEIPKKRIPWVKYFFQFALPAFLMSAKASAQGKVVCVKKENVAVASPERLKLGKVSIPQKRAEVFQKTIIKGKIIDENNKPVPYASIMIKDGGVGMSADSNGIFKMDNVLVNEDIVVEASAVGFVTREISITKQANMAQDFLIQLEAAKMLDEVVLTSYGRIKRTMVMGGISSVSHAKITEAVPVAKSSAETQPMIKVYPNPVKSGTNINVGCQKLSEGYYSIQLFTQSGQQIFNKQTWIDAEAQVLNIDIPAVAAGVYFLKLTNKEINKKFTEKIIIQ